MGLLATLRNTDREEMAAAAGYQPIPYLLLHVGTLSCDLMRASGPAMQSLLARRRRHAEHAERLRSHTARAAIRVAENAIARTNVMLAGSVLVGLVVAIAAIAIA